MAHETIDIVEGWTVRLDFQLLSDDAPVALSTSDRVFPYLADRNEAKVSTSSSAVTVITASSGAVGYLASCAGVFMAGLSPYTLRFLVKDGNGKDAFWPNADPITIGVRSV